jgi:hypothetical protein
MKTIRLSVCFCVLAAAAGRAAPVTTFEPGASPVEVAAVEQSVTATGDVFAYSYEAQGIDLQPVPEPAVILTIGSGLLALAGYWRRRTRRRAEAERKSALAA